MKESDSGLSALLVGLGTPPLLCGLYAEQVYLQVIQHIGKASLELFRGQQLPLLNLNFPQPPADSTATNGD